MYEMKPFANRFDLEQIVMERQSVKSCLVDAMQFVSMQYKFGQKSRTESSPEKVYMARYLQTENTQTASGSLAIFEK